MRGSVNVRREQIAGRTFMAEEGGTEFHDVTLAVGLADSIGV